MIKTIGELKEAINNIDDDFTIDVRIVRELSEEKLKGSRYPYPYEYSKANIEIEDIGYSDKDVFINVEEISDDVCEWKYNDTEYYWESSCDHLHIFMSDGPKENEYDFCPYCGKKIKCVDNGNKESEAE